MQNYDKLTRVLKEMIVFFDEFSVLQQKKLDAITENNVEALEGYMKEDQVFSLKLKAHERNREAAIAELALPTEGFREHIQTLDGDSAEALKQAYNTLSARVLDFKENNALISKQIEVKLYNIKNILERLDNKDVGVNTYSNKKNEGSATATDIFRSKKV